MISHSIYYISRHILHSPAFIFIRDILDFSLENTISLESFHYFQACILGIFAFLFRYISHSSRIRDESRALLTYFISSYFHKLEALRHLRFYFASWFYSAEDCRA